MPVTSRARQQRKTKDGKYVATDRCVQVILRFDTTGGKTSATRGKIEAAVRDLVENGLAAFADNHLDVSEVSGSWGFYYGPWYEGDIS